MSSSSPLLRLATPGDAEARHRAADHTKIARLTTRIKRLESTIRQFLFSTTLTTAQRDALVEVLAGLRAPDRRRRGGAITPSEKRLLLAFRAMDPTSKRSVVHLIGVARKRRTL